VIGRPHRPPPTDSVLRPWPRPIPAARWAEADLAEAVRNLERLIADGWRPEMRWQIDYGFVWTATRVDGRRFRTVARGASRNPVAAIDALIRDCEAAA
jgi:hypothetical protein